MSTAILGFGNPARSDDGVGCKVIDILKQEALQEEVTLIDMGTSAFEMLFQLKGHHRIILIDGVINSEDIDGSIFKLPAETINAAIQDDPMVFLHSLKWDQALSYAKKIMQDEYPEGLITVYLISITNTKLDIGLSPTVNEAAHKVANYIIKDLQKT